MGEGALEQWRRYRAVIAAEAMPCALVDLDALEANARALAGPLGGSGKTLRVATKSVRCPELVRRVMEVAAPVAAVSSVSSPKTVWAAGRANRSPGAVFAS